MYLKSNHLKMKKTTILAAVAVMILFFSRVGEKFFY